MGRRTSSGRIGAPTFGGLLADAETITSDDNRDIVLDPTGTGRVIVDAHLQLQAQSNLRFADGDSSNYVAFQAPTTVASNVTWLLPSSDGSNGQAIVTDGNGNLSFTDLGVSVSDNTSDSNTNYILFTTTTSGAATDIRVSAGNLEYQPSTGTLTVDNLEAGFIRETSSIVLKENIKPISNALDLLNNINGYIYDRKDGSSTHEAGFIAEEVRQIMPWVVHEDKKGLSISYTRLIAYLVEAVKTLQKDITDLKEK